MSIEEVRNQFDLPRLKAFNNYSKQYPPTHVLIASYFGFGKPSADTKTIPTQSPDNDAALAQFFTMLG